MMGIDEIQTPGFACGGFEVVSMVRRGAVVLCESETFPIEKVFVEFEDEETAQAFEQSVNGGHAEIRVDEDTSINAAPDEVREEYELALVAGDPERLENILTELWEDYGINPENKDPRETSGIKRIAIMHDDGVESFGFKDNPKVLRQWMRENGFQQHIIDGLDPRE